MKEKVLALVLLTFYLYSCKGCWGSMLRSEKSPRLQANAEVNVVTTQEKAELEESNAGNDIKKARVKRGTEEEESILSDYLYYFRDDLFYRINSAVDSPLEETRGEDKLWNKYYTTFLYPDRNQTGNRYIVFYDKAVKKDLSFIVYDKLTDKFDRDSYKSIEEPSGYKDITAIYPIDYQAGGDYLHVVFIVVYMYMDGSRKYAIVQYGKSEDGRITKKEVAKNVTSFYYNPYEKRLAFLKQPTPDRLEYHLYDVMREETVKTQCLGCEKGHHTTLQFMADDYFVINFSYYVNEKTRISAISANKIFHLDNDQPIHDYDNSELFSQSVQHNRGEFHLLLTGIKKDVNIKNISLYHVEFDESVEEDKLKNAALPHEVTREITGDKGKEIKDILFLTRKNTYYICIIKRTGIGYNIINYKLNENFTKIVGAPGSPILPAWLSKSSKGFIFKSEGNTILIQALASGRIQGIAYIDKRGKMEIKPQ